MIDPQEGTPAEGITLSDEKVNGERAPSCLLRFPGTVFFFLHLGKRRVAWVGRCSSDW